MAKYFYNKEKAILSDTTINQLRERQENTLLGQEERKRQIREAATQKNIPLNHIEGRILLIVDPEQKEYHTFSNGITIAHKRNFNNLDQKHTQQVLGTIVSAENIPAGALALFHHNCLHEVNHVHDHGFLTQEELAAGIKIISIREEECYLWKMPGETEWQPAKNFCIAERVFKPYEGLIHGILPTKIENVLYVKTGEFAGNVLHTVKATDFPIIFVNESGQEETIIRCRHFEDGSNYDREELIAVSHTLTEKLYAGDLLVGINPEDAKQVEISAYCD
jgi:hypothetical protein